MTIGGFIACDVMSGWWRMRIRGRWAGSGWSLGVGWLFLVLVVLFLNGCAVKRQPTMGKDWPGRRGANCLQDAGTPWGSEAAAESLARLRALGADTVAFIPFLRQDDVSSVAVRRSEAVTDRELRKAINEAHRLGFEVLLKPQVLVANGWAGTIDPGDAEGWELWFAAYSRALLHYARMAEELGAEWLVIGTELNHTGGQRQWPHLIAAIRSCYGGKLTFAAHNLEGVRGFAYWDLLDSIGLSYYPSLGESAELPDLRRAVQAAVDRLGRLSEEFDRPLWLLEFGIPSARGAQLAPWRWQHLDGVDVVVDTALQAKVIELWLANLTQPWMQGALLWCWSSDPQAGGGDDPHHTVQNKSAEAALRHHWQR